MRHEKVYLFASNCFKWYSYKKYSKLGALTMHHSSNRICTNHCTQKNNTQVQPNILASCMTKGVIIKTLLRLNSTENKQIITHIFTSSSKLAPACWQKQPLHQSHKQDTVRVHPNCWPTTSGWAACESFPGALCWSLHWARRWWATGSLQPGPLYCEISCCYFSPLEIQ